LRFDRLVLAARRLVRGGRVGTLAPARMVVCEPPRPLPEWKLTRQSGGGVLLDLGSHHADLARFLFSGEVRAVWARQRSERAEGDTAVLELEMADGLLVQSLLSQAAPMAHELEVHGSAGTLRLDLHRSLAPAVETLDSRLLRARHAWSGVQSLARSPFLLGRVLGLEGEVRFRASLERFVLAARDSRPAAPDLLDGARSLAVVLAAEEAIATARRVVLL
jgi:predicted dehydrogenase